jgi:hypothetical protein
MPLDTIEGKWEGYYNYGAAYGLQTHDTIVSFTVEISIDEHGIIKGTCTDDIIKELSIAPAIIEGTYENETLFFIKKYPCLILVDENNKLTTVPDKPSSEIQYKGNLTRKLFSKTYMFKGEWDISGSLLDENGNAQYYSYDGTWTLKKLVS